MSILTITAIMLLTGCTFSRVASGSSVMVRTVGVGENSMPIDGKSFAFEFFSDPATSVDAIKKIYHLDVEDGVEEIEHLLSGRILSKNGRNYGFNLRYGIDNYTEVKVGIFGGSVHSKKGESYESRYNTSFAGYQLGVKRLLVNYDNPHRVSLYAQGKYFKTSSTTFRDYSFTPSEGFVDKYDGRNIEAKFALIYGYLPDPVIKNYPSVSLYYSLANTKRDETILGIPLKKSPNAMGLEANYSFDLKRLYYMLYVGTEKELVDKATGSLNSFFGVKVGIYFNRLKG